MNEDGFCRVLVRGSIGIKEGFGTLYLKNVTEMIQNQVRFYRIDDISFDPCHGNAFSRVDSLSMTTDYIRASFEEPEKEVTVPRDNDNVWIENIERSVEFFDPFGQLFSDKSARTLKSTALVAFPVYVIL